MKTKSKTKSKVKQLLEVRTKIVLGIMLVSAYMLTVSFAALPLVKVEKAIQQPTASKITNMKVTEVKTSKTAIDDWGFDRNPNALSVCDFNNDGARNLSDVSLFAECLDTFDANGDGEHNISDLALYAQYNLNDNWCATNMSECYAEEQNSLSVCDFNNDGVRDLSDITIFAKCQNTFDANGDGEHNISDLALYAQYNQDDEWCVSSMGYCYWGIESN